MILNYKLFNPLFFYLLMFLQNKTIRNIIMYGGSSSGKTYSMAQAILILTLWEGTNHLVMRKVGASIKDTVYQDFKTAAEQLEISKLFKFSDGVKTITCIQNKARIVFKGLDDAEKIKGLSSFKRVFSMNGQSLRKPITSRFVCVCVVWRDSSSSILSTPSRRPIGLKRTYLTSRNGMMSLWL